MRADLILAVLLALNASAQAQTAAPKRKTPKRTPAVKTAPAAKPAAKPAAPKPTQKVPTPSVPEALDDLEAEPAVKTPPAPAPTATFVSPAGALSAALVETPAGLYAGEPLTPSPAAAMGLLTGDRVVAVCGKPAGTREEAASALGGWPLGARPSAVVLRGLETRRLETPAPPASAERPRGKFALSAHEQALKLDQLDAAGESASAALKSAPSLDFAVHSRQAFWLRFPSGIKDDTAPGAVYVGETTTAVATSSELDFLSLPAKSKVWARVLSVENGVETRRLRLHLFKLQPAGGHAYRVSGLITDIVGDGKLAKVSAGGTLISAAPITPDGKKPKAAPLVDSDTRLRAELLETTTLTEAPTFYRAGPGLWLRTKDLPEGRRYEISHIIVGRSAEKAGLKVGQAVHEVGGRSTSRLDFADALDALYGAPGTEVKISVETAPSKTETVTLKRGALYKDGAESVVPSPLAAAAKPQQ